MVVWVFHALRGNATNHSIGLFDSDYSVDARLFKLSRPKRQRNFHKFPLPLGVRRTVKSSTAAVVTGSLHPNEKPLSAELLRYHGHLSELHTQDHEHASDKHFGVRVVSHPL